jgi:hypothetical protein
VQGLDPIFSHYDLEDARNAAAARVNNTSCFDRGTCLRDSRQTNFALHSITALSVFAAIFAALATLARLFKRRAPVLFGLTVLIFVGAMMLTNAAPKSSESLGPILYFVPALLLSWPWSLTDLPLVGVRNDVDTGQIAVYGGMLLNLTILGALMLWRRKPREQLTGRGP